MPLERLHDGTVTERSAPRTGGNQGFQGIPDALELPHFLVHVRELGRRPRPHVGRVRLRVRAQVQELADLTQREATLLRLADETDAFAGLLRIVPESSSRRPGPRSDQALALLATACTTSDTAHHPIAKRRCRE